MCATIRKFKGDIMRLHQIYHEKTSRLKVEVMLIDSTKVFFKRKFSIHSDIQVLPTEVFAGLYEEDKAILAEG